MTRFWGFLELEGRGSLLWGGFGLCEVGGAVGAELIGVRDFALALRAGGVKIAFTVGTEIEAGIDSGGGFRGSEGEGLSNEQIDGEANEEVAAGEEKNE